MSEVDHWVEVLRHSPLGLLLDLDGTLVPLADRPELARPAPTIAPLLGEITALPGLRVAVVSGRSRSELERWFGDAGSVWLAAEHGAFLRADREWTFIAPETEPGLAELSGALASIAGRVPGSLIETKSMTVAVHYRTVPREARGAFLAEVEAAVRAWVGTRPDYERLVGSEVIEVRRATARKSAAVEWVRSALGPGARMVAVGDDVTDEDMFRALGPTDESVRVGGSGKTAARWALEGPGEVVEFLLQLRAIRSGRAGAGVKRLPRRLE